MRISLALLIFILSGCTHYVQFDPDNWVPIATEAGKYEITVQAPDGFIEGPTFEPDEIMANFLDIHYDVVQGPRIYGLRSETEIHFYLIHREIDSAQSLAAFFNEISDRKHNFHFEEVQLGELSFQKATLVKPDRQVNWYVTAIDGSSSVGAVASYEDEVRKKEKLLNSRIALTEDILETMSVENRPHK